MKIVNDIIQYLKSHGDAVSWTDEPYMQFAAEWQDWSFAKPGFHNCCTLCI